MVAIITIDLTDKADTISSSSKESDGVTHQCKFLSNNNIHSMRY